MYSHKKEHYFLFFYERAYDKNHTHVKCINNGYFLLLIQNAVMHNFLTFAARELLKY